MIRLCVQWYSGENPKTLKITQRECVRVRSRAPEPS